MRKRPTGSEEVGLFRVAARPFPAREAWGRIGAVVLAEPPTLLPGVGGAIRLFGVWWINRN